jgi:excinuclease ABC subunit A
VSHDAIELRGVAVNNLRHIALDLPRGRLIVLCGVSGSGKTSLALDTLYAEGQRRYIETFSPYTRQFLEQLDKPQAERISGLPPAIAVTHKNPSRSNRATVGTTTEINDYLSLLFARLGEVYCYKCGQSVRRDTPESAAESLSRVPSGVRIMIGFEAARPADAAVGDWLTELAGAGYVRAIVGERSVAIEPALTSIIAGSDTITIILDRLTTGETSADRLRDSLEAAFAAGGGRCVTYVNIYHGDGPLQSSHGVSGELIIDGRNWQCLRFSSLLRCDKCEIDYSELEPQLFNFNRPLGACPECEGFGNVAQIDMDRVVPDRSKSIRDGTVAPWNTPAYAHELAELLALANDYGLRIDVPYRELNEKERRLIYDGVRERNFGGLRGFFRWLERRKYKMHLRVFLSRWRSYVPCPACGGSRLRPEALAVRVAGNNFADVSRMTVNEATKFFDTLDLPVWQRTIAEPLRADIRGRLSYLSRVGLGYLTLDRPLRTLSGGEAQRVALTATLGSSLVDMLYVLDEPSIGLHPRDVASLADAIVGLRRRGNTVVVVEHEEEIIRRADQVVEIGPGAGEEGGRIVFQGSPTELIASVASRTGDWLAGRRRLEVGRRREPTHGWIKLRGARGRNLQNVSVEFPLGVLCLVTGVSGAGKSTLVQQTLYPALTRRLNRDADQSTLPAALDYDDVLGAGQLDDVVLIDQTPIGRSPRSNPATYLKAFDPIRTLFAEQTDARTRGFSPSHFSFNVEGGRCEACRGDGVLAVDMQFMADVYIRCPECGGRRYRREVLAVKYRGRDISEVLDMTAREAFTWFRGEHAVQARLKPLLDVGLDYLRLGQPGTTLSGGEAQRLKLARYLGGKRRGRTLFVLDEPTTGLHFSDIVQLVDCFDALVDVGHSLVVVEHNLQLMKTADYLIDLGPGAADEGGRVVALGTPEEVAASPDSITGQFLARQLARQFDEIEEPAT